MRSKFLSSPHTTTKRSCQKHRNNMAMVESAKPHTKRSIFFEEIKKNDAPVIKLIHKYIGPSLRKRISVYLKNKFKKEV